MKNSSKYKEEEMNEVITTRQKFGSDLKVFRDSETTSRYLEIRERDDPSVVFKRRTAFNMYRRDSPPLNRSDLRCGSF
jgi:hypothetical protein